MAGDRGEVVARFGGDPLCRRAPALIERGRKDKKRHGDRDEDELANDDAGPCRRRGKRQRSVRRAAHRAARRDHERQCGAGEPESKRGVQDQRHRREQQDHLRDGISRQGRIRRGISSYFTSNPEAVAAVNAGEIHATLVPQGTFAEAIRAAGAGIAGFLTPVGAGTPLAEGKEEHVVDGVPHVLERPIHADVALVYAARGDELGNLWYRRTARNFNPLMATAARVTIAEVGEIVSAGELEPEAIHTPHLYVDELVLSR